MASVHGPTRRSRVRQGASMGQIPLSSGEIELYSRQDEVARRRRRLLAVRDQERRVAQQVTQRYRANLQKLQGSKAQSAQRRLNVQQEALLSELHRRYQNSLQSMGTAQRNARDKLLELMEQAQFEKEKWRYNQRITGKQRVEEAEQAREEDEAVRLARRREVEENLARLKELSGKQRAYASARARREQEVALQRAKDREEAVRMRRMHAPEEVFVTPRPHEKDLSSYQFTRTHCLALPTGEVAGTSKPAVTVIRHNTRHPTAVNGADEASKYRDEVDQTRERDRLVKEEQDENATERGEGALNAVASRQKGQQALEWLALVDKMERRERIRHFGEGEDRVQDAVVAEERDGEQPERMTERAFARMFDLDEEESVDLSAFSIDTDEGEQPVGPAPTVYGQLKDDKLAGSGGEYRVKLKAAKPLEYPESAESLDGKEPGGDGLSTSGRRAKYADDELDKTGTQNPAGGRERNNSSLKKNEWNFGTPSEGESGPRKQTAEEGGLVDKLDKVAKDRLVADEEGDSERQDATTLRWDQRKRRTVDETHENLPIHRANEAKREMAVGGNQGRHRQSNRGLEGTHESLEAEAENLFPNLQHQRDHSSLEQLDKRLEEVFLNLQSANAPRDRSVSTASRRPDDPISPSSSGSENGQRVAQLDEGALRSTNEYSAPAVSQTSRHGSDSARDTSVVSLSVVSGESALSLSAALGSFTASEAHASTTSHREHLVATEQDLLEEEHLADTNRASLSGTSFASSVNRSEERAGQSSHLGFPVEMSRMRLEEQDGGGDTPSVASSFHGDEILSRQYGRSGSSAGSSRSNFQAQGDDGWHSQLESTHGARGPRSERREKGRGDPMISYEEQEQEHSVLPQGHRSPATVLETQQTTNDPPLTPSHRGNRSSLASSVASIQQVTSGMLQAAHSPYPELPLSMNADSDGRSSSRSSSAPSERALYRPDQAKEDTQMEQRFIDDHLLSFSSSEAPSEDGGEHDTDLGRSSIGDGKKHPSITRNPDDLYRQQIEQQARRESTSASSIAQYSLPPSDSQSSFDDSFYHLHPGLGEDSFVNELVPMFPKPTGLQQPRSLEARGQAAEHYGVQLVAPNMSRMLARSRRSTPGPKTSSRPVSPDHPTAAEVNSTQRLSATAPHLEGRALDASDRQKHTGRRITPTSSRRSPSGASGSESDVRSVGASVEEPWRQERPGSRQRRQKTIADYKQQARAHRSPAGGEPDALEDDEIDERSEFSDSGSGVSSLGFAVQLHLAAGTTRRRKSDGEAQRRATTRSRSQSDVEELEDPVSNIEHDNQSNVSGRSFASGSSLSMDAHFNYLVDMTTAVGKSLPLHLRLPAMIYGKKDMSKPPAPMAWSTSSDSSSVSDRRAVSKVFEMIPQTGREPSIRSSLSESLEEQVEPRPAAKLMQDDVERREGISDSQKSVSIHRRSRSSSRSSASNSDNEAEPVMLERVKAKVARLPPPPLGSLDMSHPPAPLHQFSSSPHSSRSSTRYSDGLQSVDGHQSHRNVSHRPYEAGEEERKEDDSSSDNGAASSNESSSSEGSSASLRKQQRPKKAERLIVPGGEDDEQESQELSLAEAFQLRHPSFQRRVESHHDRLRRQRAEHREQQQNERQQPTGRPAEAKRDFVRGSQASRSPRGRSAATPPPPLDAEKQELLDRLATGARAKISSHEMKERSRRLYHQLPEVVERKRQEEMLRRRRQRLNELREQEQARRLQQKQRRQQQLQQRR